MAEITASQPPGRSRSLSAWDGLALHVQEWGAGPATPLLCLPGLVRTGDDFAALALRHGNHRRVVAIDYAGRGQSGRAPDIHRYAPEACLRDVLDVCAALHLHRVVVIGTSFGGLLAMAIAAARPGLLAGVVLNDVGPEIGATGASLIRDFIADDPALPDLAAAAAHLRDKLPDLSFVSAAEWRMFAALTYQQGADQRWHPRWDTRIARLMDAPVPPLWPLFGALAAVPLLLVHGEVSQLLLPATVARMQAMRPDMTVATVAKVGHAPTLAEPVAQRALDGFLGR